MVEIAASHLDDPELLRRGFRRVARALGRADVAEAVIVDDTWFHGAGPEAEGPEAASVVALEQARPYVRHVPVYSIRAAAGRFLENAAVEEEGWVEAPGRLREGMLAVRVAGRSMEPRIPDGALALFRGPEAGGPIAGAREGRIVLAALHEATDPESGASFTVKRYRSEKQPDSGGGWAHARVVLESLNPDVPGIELESHQSASIVAEFVTVLGAGVAPLEPQG